MSANQVSEKSCDNKAKMKNIHPILTEAKTLRYSKKNIAVMN